jgi:uncharacterized protein with GYD domain
MFAMWIFMIYLFGEHSIFEQWAILMSTYIMLVNFTDQGRKGVKEADKTNRAK